MEPKLAVVKQLDLTYSNWTIDTLRSYLASVGLTALTHYLLYGKDEGLSISSVLIEEQVSTGE
jgi:hypothetical protein